MTAYMSKGRQIKNLHTAHQARRRGSPGLSGRQEATTRNLSGSTRFSGMMMMMMMVVMMMVVMVVVMVMMVVVMVMMVVVVRVMMGMVVLV